MTAIAYAVTDHLSRWHIDGPYIDLIEAGSFDHLATPVGACCAAAIALPAPK